MRWYLFPVHPVLFCKSVSCARRTVTCHLDIYCTNVVQFLVLKKINHIFVSILYQWSGKMKNEQTYNINLKSEKLWEK